MHSLSEFGFDLMELFRKSHPHRCSLYHELSIPADTAVMRESQKVEGLRLAPSVYALAVLRRKAPKSVASFPHLEHLNKLPSEKSIHIVIFPCSVSKSTFVIFHGDSNFNASSNKDSITCMYGSPFFQYYTFTHSL